ncbi:hypothetical protein LCGC14_1381820, partial [marine sediment metagenome]
FPQFGGVDVFATPTDPAFTDQDDRASGHRVMTCMCKRDPRVWQSYGQDVFTRLLGPASQWSPKNVLISDEGIGRAGSRPDLLAAHLVEIGRIAADWGLSRVAVICAVRRQDHWLASHYSQMSDRNRDASQADFERAAHHLVRPSGDRFKLGMMLDYATLAAFIRDAVGRENLLLYPYERQCDNPEDVYAEMAAFAGADCRSRVKSVENTPDLSPEDANVRSVSRDRWSIRPLSQSSRLLPFRVSRAIGPPHTLNPPRLLREKSFALTQNISRIVLDTYGPSNERLCREFGVDGAKYDYF